MTATNWLLYQLTDSPVQLGLNGIFRAIPAIGFGLISGTLADRYDRRRLMLWTQLLLGLLALGLGVLDHSGHVQAWQIYAFTFVSATVGSFDGPARQALFPSLVPRAVLPNAVALNSLLWKGAALLGPTLGGVAISLMGTAGAFYANAASFLVVVVALLLMRTSASARRRHHDFLSETKAGFSYIVSRPIVLGVMIMEGVSSVFGLDNAMLTIFASDILHVGASRVRPLAVGPRSRCRHRLESVHRHGPSLRPWENTFYFGGSLRDWLCSVRSFPFVPALFSADRVRRPDGHDLVRLPQHDPSTDYAGKFPRPSDGSFSVEQPGASSFGSDRDRIGRAADGGAGGNLFWRAAGNRGNLDNRLAGARNTEIPLKRNGRSPD